MASYFPMVKNSAQRIVFPILDADGDPVTGAASDTPDSEYSLDGGSFTNIADEIHELATASGIYYLDLTADETNGDVVCIQIKTATAETKTTVLVFYTAAQSLDTMDTNIDDIETDTNEIQTKLPTNKFMGSSDGADDDGTLNTIAGDVENIDGSSIPTPTQIQTEMEENGDSILDTLNDKLPAAQKG